MEYLFKIFYLLDSTIKYLNTNQTQFAKPTLPKTRNVHCSFRNNYICL